MVTIVTKHEFGPMGRPSILLDRPMTTAERQRRHRAKLREQVHAEDVLARLDRDYIRAGVNEQPTIRKGVKRLLARWQRDAEANRRYWSKRFPKLRSRQRIGRPRR